MATEDEEETEEAATATENANIEILDMCKSTTELILDRAGSRLPTEHRESIESLNNSVMRDVKKLITLAVGGPIVHGTVFQIPRRRTATVSKCQSSSTWGSCWLL